MQTILPLDQQVEGIRMVRGMHRGLPTAQRVYVVTTHHVQSYGR